MSELIPVAKVELPAGKTAVGGAEEWAGVLIGGLDVSEMLFAGGRKEWAKVDIGDGDIAALLNRRRKSSVDHKRPGIPRANSGALGVTAAQTTANAPATTAEVPDDETNEAPKSEESVGRTESKDQATKAAAEVSAQDIIGPPPGRPPLPVPKAGNDDLVGSRIDELLFCIKPSSRTSSGDLRTHLVQYLNQTDDQYYGLLRTQMDLHKVVASAERVRYLLGRAHKSERPGKRRRPRHEGEEVEEQRGRTRGDGNKKS